MSDAWLAFAREGDPSTATLPWPRYDIHKRPTMLFDRNSQVAEDPGSAERQLLERLLPPLSA
jgi:para-nitrobenzyl esterase